ncbi:hypothetical protein [Asanoa iriomotensis]|uniref:Uncharacterized protein n=1 Tax=Asanoa iriomotensis TaxID=234613 RepID=A0ABQ4CFM9_9ACTN|nr:hypothetical protein [Asanoa iriomotensis]GIF61576.1 hypothetical protein Air01nite_76710 [Asanoa iriomotensis]
MEGAENPILYIEERRRLPLRRRRPEVPGAVVVYRSRAGRLSAPAGGYTAGELWWRGPRVRYEIDVTSHPLRLTWEVDNPHGVRASVEVSGSWRVVDPIAIVANRVTDGPRRCRHRVETAIADAFSASRDLGELAKAVRRGLPRSLVLAEGIAVDQLTTRVIAGGPRHRLVRDLLTTDPGDDEGGIDPIVELRNDAELARAGLNAIAARDADGDDGLIDAALRRYAALLARLEAHAADDKPGAR